MFRANVSCLLAVVSQEDRYGGLRELSACSSIGIWAEAKDAKMRETAFDRISFADDIVVLLNCTATYFWQQI